MPDGKDMCMAARISDIDFPEALSMTISQVSAAVINTGLYSPDHPQVQHCIDRAYSLLVEILAQKKELTILLIAGDLIINDRPLTTPAAAATASNFVRILQKKAIERLTFLPELSKPELQAFILDLAASDAAAIRSRQSIKLGKVELRVLQSDDAAGPSGSASQQAPVSPEAMQELMSLTATERDALKELYLSVKKHKKIDVRGVEDIVKSFIQGVRRDINPLNLLASLKSFHEYTFTHVTNVCILTMNQAESLGFAGEHLHQIGVAALLHDVGKVFIPEEILSKPGKLTDEERRVIEAHTIKGARYLMGLEGIPRLSVLAALEHHLKYDASGYPSIRGGWTPNIVSQLIAVADVFDAMRSKRSYQDALPVDTIAGVLTKGSGTSFNPVLVDNFLTLIGYARHEDTRN
jgi:HD-GYP domain-containing protein (c-di-GMP phosphodiesterase class II)